MVSPQAATSGSPAGLTSVGSVGGRLVTCEQLHIEAIVPGGAFACCVHAYRHRTPHCYFPGKFRTSQQAELGELRPEKGDAQVFSKQKQENQNSLCCYETPSKVREAEPPSPALPGVQNSLLTIPVLRFCI